YSHTTGLQARKANCGAAQFTCGAGTSIRNVDGILFNFVSRNNIWQIHKTTDTDPPGSHDFRSIIADCSTTQVCTVNNDLFNSMIIGAGAGAEANGWGNVAGGHTP